MIATRLLTREQFLACFAAPMRDVTGTAGAALDIWPYVDAIALPLDRVGEVRDVARVYRDADDRFEQVLIGTDIGNLFLVVVVDLASGGVHGHHLLDLTAEYAAG